MEGTIQVKIEGADELAKALQNFSSVSIPIVQSAIEASVAILAKYTVKGNVPWRTGNLTQSFRSETGPLFARWFPTANYAGYVYYGTKPHVIKPTNKKALFWPGAAHPVRQVNHPGTRPIPYLDTIVTEAGPDIDTLFGTALDKILQQMTK